MPDPTGSVPAAPSHRLDTAMRLETAQTGRHIVLTGRALVQRNGLTGSPALLFPEPRVGHDAYPLYEAMEGHRTRYFDGPPVEEGLPTRPNPIDGAERLDRALSESGLRTLAAFAARIGVSTARVSQVLALLRLPESVKDHVRRLGPVVGRSSISERDLRPIAALRTAPAQSRAFRALLRRKARRVACRNGRTW